MKFDDDEVLLRREAGFFLSLYLFVFSFVEGFLGTSFAVVVDDDDDDDEALSTLSTFSSSSDDDDES